MQWWIGSNWSNWRTKDNRCIWYKKQILDKRIGTIITQVYNHLIASEVKLELLEYYNDETEIYYVRAAGIQGEESIRKIPLYD